jgi:hypothetical protein
LGFIAVKPTVSFLLRLLTVDGKKAFALQENCFSTVKSEADFLPYGLQPEVGVESLFALSSATEQHRQTRNLMSLSVILSSVKIYGIIISGI